MAEEGRVEGQLHALRHAGGVRQDGGNPGCLHFPVAFDRGDERIERIGVRSKPRALSMATDFIAWRRGSLRRPAAVATKLAMSMPMVTAMPCGIA